MDKTTTLCFSRYTEVFWKVLHHLWSIFPATSREKIIDCVFKCLKLLRSNNKFSERLHVNRTLRSQRMRLSCIPIQNHTEFVQLTIGFIGVISDSYLHHNDA